MVKIPELRRALKGGVQGEIVIPYLQAALHDPNYESVDIHIEGFEAREPDGYFHPSTHSTWNVRQLALYRLAPHLVDQETMPFTGTLSITQGHFWHTFLQHILMSGPLEKPELPFSDEIFMRRGHMDGLLKNGEGLEIKTINSRGASKVYDEETLKSVKYQYWCQAQEYLDVFGLEAMRFLFITPDFPFNMKEFLVPANPEHQAARREIYARAIEISDVGKLPISKYSVPCCGRPDQCATVKGCNYGG